LKSNAYAATSNRGVDEWGVYFEWVELLGDMATIYKYCRAFVARNHVSFYERKAGTARTTWKPNTKASPEEARAFAEKLLGRRSNNVMRGSPILVQLEPADVEMIERGKSPAARYRATLAHQGLFGVLEKEQDAAPTGFDYSGVDKAVEAINKLVAPTPPAGVDWKAMATDAEDATATTLLPPPPDAPSKATTLSEPIDWSAVTDQEPY